MTDNEILKALEAYNGYTVIDLAIKLIKRQKAEIDRLEAYKRLYEDLKAENLEIIKAIKHCRADAVKKFAERLRSHYVNYEDYEDIYAHHIRDDIDFLVAEMTEEEK